MRAAGCLLAPRLERCLSTGSAAPCCPYLSPSPMSVFWSQDGAGLPSLSSLPDLSNVLVWVKLPERCLAGVFSCWLGTGTS